MKLKVFTLRYDSATDRFDDTELTGFLQNRRCVSVYEHFFERDGVPVWAMLLSYRDDGQATSASGVANKQRTDWRSAVAEPDRPLFDVVRRWRNDRAKREGRPPYVFLTNQQIAEIARRRPTSISALREIEGIGDARIESFGEELPALIATAADATPVETEDADAQ